LGEILTTNNNLLFAIQVCVVTKGCLLRFNPAGAEDATANMFGKLIIHMTHTAKGGNNATNAY